MAQQLSWGTIHRLWQMLLKGLQDVEIAPDPREAAEMALLRLIHAADMPDPASLIARLSGDGSGRSAGARAGGKASGPTARFRPISPGSIECSSRAGSICLLSSFTTRSASFATHRRSWY